MRKNNQIFRFVMLVLAALASLLRLPVKALRAMVAVGRGPAAGAGEISSFSAVPRRRQTNLTRAWVRRTTRMGWRFLPAPLRRADDPRFLVSTARAPYGTECVGAAPYGACRGAGWRERVALTREHVLGACSRSARSATRHAPAGRLLAGVR